MENEFKLTPKNSRHIAAVVVLVLALVGVVVLSQAMSYGPWARSDSAAYLISARNLAAGKGLGVDLPSGGIRPTSGHPPFYQLILAIFILMGIPAFQAAEIINLVAFFLGFSVLGISLLYSNRSVFIALLFTSIFYFHPLTFSLFAGAITEPLFISLSAVAISFATLAIARETSSNRLLWLSATAAGLAWLTRYPAVVLVAAIIASFLLFSTQIRGAIKISVRYLALSSAPSLAWLAWLRFGPAGQNPRALRNSLDGIGGRMQNLRAGFVENVWDWLPFESVITEPPYRYQLGILMLLATSVIVVFLFARYKGWLTKDSGSVDRSVFFLGTISLVFGFLFIALVAVVVAISYPTPDLNSRVLSPLLLSGVLSLASVASLIHARLKDKLMNTFILGLMTLVFVTGLLPQTVDQTIELARRGRGYTGLSWKNSETIRAISNLPDDISLISSDPAAVLLLANRPTYSLTVVRDGVPVSGANELIEGGSQKLIQSLESGEAALIIFDGFYWQLHPYFGDKTDALIHSLTDGLSLFGNYNDGEIYLNQ